METRKVIVSLVTISGVIILTGASAIADPTGRNLAIEGRSTVPIPGVPVGTTWGGNPPNPAFPQPAHPFGGVSVYDDVVYGPGFTVRVTSDTFANHVPSIELPPGKKFGGWIKFDFTNFDPADFNNYQIDIFDIKLAGEPNYINSVEVNIGVVSSDGNGIFWSGFGSDLGGTSGARGIDVELNFPPQFVEILWTQRVPSPGGPAILALGAIVASRRRR